MLHSLSSRGGSALACPIAFYCSSEGDLSTTNSARPLGNYGALAAG